MQRALYLLELLIVFEFAPKWWKIMHLMHPVTLKTKYAFHTLLWLLKPDVVLDIGSMDGADSKRFRKLLPKAELAAFEANPYNYQAMCKDGEIANCRIRVVNKLVSGEEGERSFFVQKPDEGMLGFNRGTSSALPRNDQGLQNEEIQIESVRMDSFLEHEYPAAKSVALWVDVEGYAYEVLEGMAGACDRIHLMHVEVETRECWPGQRLESDVLRLAKSMGYIQVAQGSNDVQRDIILVSQSWYAANKIQITAALRLARWVGPTLSKVLAIYTGL
jgi:FkbM family methyltransferase